jgi:SAM-dependent methyltransferase
MIWEPMPIVAKPCIVCGGENFAFLVSDVGFDWEECRGCGFVRLSKPVSLAESAAIEDGATEVYLDGYLTKKFKSKMTRSRRRARRMRRRARGDDFLDIGSNYGFMVETAEQLGFHAIGVEVNKTLLQAARSQFPNRTFRAGLLEEQDFGDRRFDAVYCSEVIEHTADPRDFLKHIAAAMKPGGVLYLTTPHIREYRKRNFTGMGAPGHKLYFNERNISRLLTDCGFTDIHHDFTFFRGIKLWARRAA